MYSYYCPCMIYLLLWSPSEFSVSTICYRKQNCLKLSLKRNNASPILPDGFPVFMWKRTIIYFRQISPKIFTSVCMECSTFNADCLIRDQKWEKRLIHCTKFDVLTAVKLSILVSWVLAFRETKWDNCYYYTVSISGLKIEAVVFLRKIDIYLHAHAALQPRPTSTNNQTIFATNKMKCSTY